jgi:hypothetical protein
MTADKGRLIFSISLLIWTAAALFTTLGLSRTARMVPLSVIPPTLFLLIVILILELTKAAGAETAEVPGGSTVVRAGEVRAFLWLLLLLFLVYLLGFILASPIYIFLYLRFRSRESLTFSISMAAGIGLFIYVVFDLLLKARLHQGLLQ